MLKKIGISLIATTMLLGSLILVKATGDSVSPIALPTQQSTSTDGKFRVVETQRWLDNDYEEGLVNFRLERDVEITTMKEDLDVVYLLDSSNSMGGERSRNLQVALMNSASYFLGPGLNNRTNCVIMNDRAFRYYFENDTVRFGQILQSISTYGGTNLEAGLDQVYLSFISRIDQSRKPVVVVITDGGGVDSVAIQTYQAKLKALGAEIRVIQYMDGDTLSPLLSGLASSPDKSYAVSKIQDINDALKSVSLNILDTVTYNDVRLELNLKDKNFSINDISADVGKFTQNGNKLIWSIPQLISGKDVNLRVKVKLKNKSLKGNILVHDDTDTISYKKSNEALPAIPISLSSTTLTRNAYTIHFDGGGATQGSAPADIEVIGKGIMDIPTHAGSLTNGNAVFRGWQKPDKTFVNNKLGKPQADLTLTATWGNVEIEMNTDTKESIQVSEINKPGDEITNSAIWDATTKIEFVDFVDPAATIDLSKSKDGSVKAWMGVDSTADTLYIGSENYILAPMDNSSFFGLARNNIETINFNNLLRFQTNSSAKEMFLDYYELKSIMGMSNTTGINDMNRMFKGCKYLTEIENFKNFDTSLVTDISYLFYNCTRIESIDFSNWDTRNLTTMDSLFIRCIWLSKIDFTNFNTENVTIMKNFFLDCNSLEELDVSSFDTSNVTNMEGLFANGAIEKLTLGNFDTSKVTNMNNMFSSIYIKELDLSSFNTSNVDDMSQMFSFMEKLELLDLSSFDIKNTTLISVMFGGSHHLKTVYVKDEATATRMKNESSVAGTAEVKTKTSRAALSEFGAESPAQVREEELKNATVNSYMGFYKQIKSTLKSIAGTIDGGKIKPNEIVQYSIKTKFEAANDVKDSAIITVSNPLPKDMTLDISSIENKGVSRIIDGDGGEVHGEIYSLKTENNVITYEVRGLSPGAQIILSYKANAPAVPINTYKEFLNQSTATIEGLSLASNYVRHYFSIDPVAVAKHKLSYTYDASAFAGAPSLPEAWDYITNQEVRLPDLTMPGFTFQGWHLPDGTFATSPFFMPDNALTLTGSWSPIPVAKELKSKVIFVSDGEVPARDLPNTQEYVVGTKDTIVRKEVKIPDAPTADGYVFLGWDSPYLTQVDKDYGSFMLGEDNVTLTAKWAKQKYQLTYAYSSITAGAPVLPAPINVDWGSEVNTIGKESVTGFEFDGWYTNNDLGSNYQTTFTMPQEDVTLYAGWINIPYNVFYEYEGDVADDAQILGKTQSVKDIEVNTWIKPTSTATTDKYGTIGTWTFDGWQSDDVSIRADSFIMPANDITIKGTWTFTENLNIRYVDFKISNGTWADGSKIDQRVIVELDDVSQKTTLLEKDIPKNMISNEGYSNGKWNITPDTGIDKITDHITYTYSYEKKKYNIAVQDNNQSLEKIIQDITYGSSITINDTFSTMLDQYLVNDDMHTIVLPEKAGKRIVDFVIAKEDDGNAIVTVIYVDIEQPTSSQSEGDHRGDVNQISTGDSTQLPTLCVLLSISGGVLYLLMKKNKKNVE